MSRPALPEIPGYRIVRELGRGGMAHVYLAVQESLSREVALKLLLPTLAADPSAAKRFLREARTAASLAHRHIVGIHDVGVYEDQPYLAMEYVPGGAVSPDNVFEPQAALTIVREIALALDHAHAHGVIHRDIKPENVLVRADGSHALSDFGIARSASEGTVLTQEGLTAGTPHYMSPEQLQGEALDGRADLYGLGVMLYQLLTGELPYKGGDAMAVALKHLHAPVPVLPEHLQRFQFLVSALMAKNRDHRPATGARVAQIVQTAQTGGLVSNLDWLAEPPGAWQRWRGGLAVVGVAALVWAGWHFLQPEAVAQDPGRRPANTTPARVASADNKAAYDEYLKGMALMANRKSDELLKAAAHFERAITLDPGYARAYAAAATSYSLLSTMQALSNAQIERRSQYTDRALELDPNLGEAHIVRAWQLDKANDLAAAEMSYQRGIALAPSYGLGLQTYAMMLLHKRAQPDRALTLLERAIAVEPASASARERYARALAAVGRVDDATAAADRLITEHPEFTRGYRLRADLLAEQGDLAGALRAYNEAISRNPEAETDKVERCLVMLGFGASRQARDCMASVSREHPISDQQRAALAEFRIEERNTRGALVYFDEMKSPPPWPRATILQAIGRHAEALAVIRTLVPELFTQPVESVPITYSLDPVLVAASLMETGARAHGIALVQHSLRSTASRPIKGQFGRGWSDLYGYALLGDIPKACAAFDEVVASGIKLWHYGIDSDPLVDPVRKEPCYVINIAALRARDAEQVAAAKKAGLL